MPKLIFRTERAVCWECDGEFYVYRASGGDPRVCPSIGMAREVAAGL